MACDLKLYITKISDLVNTSPRPVLHIYFDQIPQLFQNVLRGACWQLRALYHFLLLPLSMKLNHWAVLRDMSSNDRNRLRFYHRSSEIIGLTQLMIIDYNQKIVLIKIY